MRQQQEVFGRIFREQLLPALRRHGIRILSPNELNEEQDRFVDNWFEEHAVAKLNAAFIRAEIPRWTEIVRLSGATAD